MEYLQQHLGIEETPDISHCRYGSQNVIGLDTHFGCKISPIYGATLHFHGETEKEPKLTKQLFTLFLCSKE